ncbi:Transcription elongation factor spt6 [Phlyctochytrium bullatum]|nr:Transcription elongation factor spt6 [Phlyctochytrium bullatum]
MLTNENSETLRPGMVVSCRVAKVFDRFVKVVLNSGVEGTIHLSKLPGNPSSAVDVFQENQFVEAAVIQVDLERGAVELDGREDAVGRDWLKRISKTLHKEDWDYLQEEQDEQRKPVPLKAQKAKQARVVQHPFWKNFTYQQAAEYLAQSNIRKGTVVIRPSTKGNHHLSMTWKIDDGIYQHIDIAERRKENEWSVGKELTVEGKQYEDLDEVIAMHIEPIAALFAEAVQHQKFKRLGLNDMFRWIGSQAAATKRSAYGVIFSTEKPGSLLLVYQHPANRPKQELISVTPDGFQFRGEKYRKLDAVFNAFKQQESAKASSNRRPPQAPSSRTAPSSGLPSRPSSARPPPSSFNPRGRPQVSQQVPSLPARPVLPTTAPPLRQPVMNSAMIPGMMPVPVQGW